MAFPEPFEQLRLSNCPAQRKQSPNASVGQLVETLAERGGFEPPIEFPLYTLSKRAPSTTRPSLQRGCGRNSSVFPAQSTMRRRDASSAPLGTGKAVAPAALFADVVEEALGVPAESEKLSLGDGG